MWAHKFCLEICLQSLLGMSEIDWLDYTAYFSPFINLMLIISVLKILDQSLWFEFQAVISKLIEMYCYTFYFKAW